MGGTAECRIWARGVAWIILSAFEADDGGSNPPGLAILLIYFHSAT